MGWCSAWGEGGMWQVDRQDTTKHKDMMHADFCRECGLVDH
jgi:hypothetical protein